MLFISPLIIGAVLGLSHTNPLPAYYWTAIVMMALFFPLVEAKAPHTWDNPFLYIAAYLIITGAILLFSDVPLDFNTILG